MIEILDLGSDKVIGLKVNGKITRNDIQNIVDEIESRALFKDDLAVYAELDTCGGLTLEALTTELFQLFPRVKQFKKKAVVSDLKWLGKAVGIGDQMLPFMDVRHFTKDEKQEAIDWVRE